VVQGQHGAPTPAHSIADAVARALTDASLAQKTGLLYHLSMAGDTTWHGFAREILAAAGIDVPVVPIASSEYRAAAVRPKNSLLDNARLRAAFGIELPDWREGLREVSSRIDAV